VEWKHESEDDEHAHRPRPQPGRFAGARAARFGVLGILALALAAGDAALGAGARIRDIARIQGVRDNQLVGYGLVVGLDGTGDKSATGFTLRSMSSLLEAMGMTIAPNDMSVKNVAAVMVTATLPPSLARDRASTSPSPPWATPRA